MTHTTTFRCCGHDLTVTACYEIAEWMSCPECGEWLTGKLKGQVVVFGGDSSFTPTAEERA